MILQVKGIPWKSGESYGKLLMGRKSHQYIGGGSFQKSLQSTIMYNHLTILPSRKSAPLSLWIPKVNLDISRCFISHLPAQAATPMPMLPSWTEMHRPHEEGSALVPVAAIFVSLFSKSSTPPKTNMEPENGPLEKKIPIGNHHFQVPC